MLSDVCVILLDSAIMKQVPRTPAVLPAPGIIRILPLGTQWPCPALAAPSPSCVCCFPSHHFQQALKMLDAFLSSSHQKTWWTFLKLKSSYQSPYEASLTPLTKIKYHKDLTGQPVLTLWASSSSLLHMTQFLPNFSRGFSRWPEGSWQPSTLSTPSVCCLFPLHFPQHYTDLPHFRAVCKGDKQLCYLSIFTFIQYSMPFCPPKEHGSDWRKENVSWCIRKMWPWVLCSSCTEHSSAAGLLSLAILGIY